MKRRENHHAVGRGIVQTSFSVSGTGKGGWWRALGVITAAAVAVQVRADDIILFSSDDSPTGPTAINRCLLQANQELSPIDFRIKDIDANHIRVYGISLKERHVLMMSSHSGNVTQFLNFDASAVGLEHVAVSGTTMLLSRIANSQYQLVGLPIDDDGLAVSEDVLVLPAFESNERVVDVAVTSGTPPKAFAIIETENPPTGLFGDTYRLVQSNSSGHVTVHDYGEVFTPGFVAPLRISGNATDLFVWTDEGIERRLHISPSSSTLVVPNATFNFISGSNVQGDISATNEHIYFRDAQNNVWRADPDGGNITFMKDDVGLLIAAQNDTNDEPRIIINAPSASKRIRGKRWAMTGITTDDDPPLRFVTYKVYPETLGTRESRPTIFDKQTGVWFFIHRFKASELKKFRGRVRFAIHAMDRGFKVFRVVRAHQVQPTRKKPRPRA